MAAIGFRCAPICPGLLPPCGRGGSAGTAVTPVATSCGTSAPTCSPRGRTETTPDATAAIDTSGRWSLITEHIGSCRLSGAIQFVAPAKLGCPPDSDDAVAICAHLGANDAPVDVGWFIHHVRSTPNGAEMRSRFWMGGPHIAVHKAPDVASKAVRPIASRLLGNAETSARNLLVHCAQEMNHLAGFLPELYAAFGDE
jgi:hypothetical protein